MIKDENEKCLGRLAPTPSGFLHVGNAVSFVLTYLMVRSRKGDLLLRVDDIDRERYRREYLEDIFRSLEWLGLDYDLGPSSVAEFENEFSQGLSLDRYQVFLNRLMDSESVFPCGCSRKDLKNNGGHVSGCLEKLKGAEPVWRVRTKDVAVHFQDFVSGGVSVNLDEEMKEFVLRKKNLYPSYQLVSLVEDLQMGVNLVVRGQDLLASTAAQIHLSRLLGERRFVEADFYHHPLVNDSQGVKLSKSSGSVSLKSARDAGSSPAFVFRKVSELLHLPEPCESLSDLKAIFQESRLPKILT